MAKRKGSLLIQLTVNLSLAIVFLSLASFYYQYQVEKHILTGSIRGDLARQAGLLRAWLEGAPGPEARRKVAEQYVETIRHLDKAKQQVMVVDARGKLVATNIENAAGHPLLDEALARPSAAEGKCIEVDGEYIIALPCRVNGELIAGVLLKQPLTAVDRLADSLMLGAFVLLAATLVIIVLVVHYVLRVKVHRPMQAIFMQQYRIREGDLAKIEAEDPANEFSDLYAMYNEMVVRIAEQKRAIFGQQDHVALAHLVRQTIDRLTRPLDDTIAKSRALLEQSSSLSDADRATLKELIANITQMARELRSIVVEGDKSATWLKREAEKIDEHTKESGDPKAGPRA